MRKHPREYRALEEKEELTVKTLNQRVKRIGSQRRKNVEARSDGLIAEVMTLQELRQARKLTQVRMAKVLAISQDGVSRLEGAAIFCSPHSGRVSKRWAQLALVAEFPDREPVLSGIAEVEPS